MRKHYLVNMLLMMLLLASCTVNSWAFVNMPSSARSLAVGSAGAAMPGGLGEVLVSNPALLTSADAGVSLFYNNKFSIPGFEEESFSLSWQTAFLHWGAFYQKEGVVLSESNQGGFQDNQWQESKLGLGLALQFRKQTSLGLGLWHQTRTITVADDPEDLFGQEKDLLTTLGFHHDGQMLGFSAVYEGFAGDNQTKLGVRLGEIGRLIALAEVRYELSEKRTNYYAGVEAWLAPNFALRAGVDPAGMFTAGLGIGKGNWKLDYTYKVHPAGNAHYLGTGYAF